MKKSACETIDQKDSAAKTSSTTTTSMHPNKRYATFEKAVAILLLLGQLTAVCPLAQQRKRTKIRGSTTSTNNSQVQATIKQSTPLLVYSLLVLLTFLSLTVYEFLQKDNINAMSANISIFKEFVNKYLHFALGCLCVTLAIVQKHKLESFLDLISLADFKMAHVVKVNNCFVSRRYFILKLSLGVVIFVVMICLLYLCEPLDIVVGKSMLTAILYGTFGQLMGCLHLVQLRFRRINKAFDSFNTVQSACTLDSKITKALAFSHDILCDSAIILNDTYTVQLLGLFTLVFLSCLFAIFGNFQIMFMANADDLTWKEIGVMVLRETVIATYVAGMGIALIASASKASEEANETGKIIHKIINNNSESQECDNLNSFSLQLIYRNVTFNVCHMFTLDYTLLYTLIGASTTYLVILIQFDLAKPSITSEKNCTLFTN